MKVGLLITARLKSTRLPGKLLLKIFDTEMMTWMVKRVKLSKVLDEIIIATSTNEKDTRLCQIADENGIKYFRGSENDVVERLYYAAKEFHLDYVLNITADCPLVSYDFFDKVVEEYKRTNADLITINDLSHGFYVYGVKVEALKKVLEIKNDNDTEIWGGYFKETGLFVVKDMAVPKEYHRVGYRLTLDYQEDFDFFEAVFHGIGKETYKKTTRELLKFLDAHPEIVSINSQCEKKYQDRWNSQKKVILK